MINYLNVDKKKLEFILLLCKGENAKSPISRGYLNHLFETYTDRAVLVGTPLKNIVVISWSVHKISLLKICQFHINVIYAYNLV